MKTVKRTPNGSCFWILLYISSFSLTTGTLFDPFPPINQSELYYLWGLLASLFANCYCRYNDRFAAGRKWILWWEHRESSGSAACPIQPFSSLESRGTARCPPAASRLHFQAAPSCPVLSSWSMEESVPLFLPCLYLYSSEVCLLSYKTKLLILPWIPPPQITLEYLLPFTAFSFLFNGG